MLKGFKNSGGVGSEYTSLDVLTGGRNGAVAFLVRLGELALDELRGFIDDMVPGDQLPNVVLSGEDVKALIALLQREQPPVEVATNVDKDGAKIPGSKRYALWITHDELHLIHWALKTGEAVVRKDPRFIENGVKYAMLRTEVVNDEAFSEFVDKFDNVHRQARIDDGEEVGTPSTAATPPTPA